MNIDDVRQRLKAIEIARADDETAHGMEDELHQDVLKAIADGTAESPKEMAALACTSENIEFCRWCA